MHSNVNDRVVLFMDAYYITKIFHRISFYKEYNPVNYVAVVLIYMILVKWIFLNYKVALIYSNDFKTNVRVLYLLIFI